jgi:hypothetical protein
MKTLYSQAEMQAKGQKFTSDLEKEKVMNSSLCADQDSSDNITEQSPLMWAVPLQNVVREEEAEKRRVNILLLVIKTNTHPSSDVSAST